MNYYPFYKDDPFFAVMGQLNEFIIAKSVILSSLDKIEWWNSLLFDKMLTKYLLCKIGIFNLIWKYCIFAD